jgi:vacuolar-type H+-ATPase subunit E/Vma4
VAETVKEKDPQAMLHKEILADAQRQSGRLLRRAQQEAEAITAQAEEEAAAHREQALEQARQTAGRRSAVRLARIPVVRTRLRAAHIEKLLTSVRTAAAEQLAPSAHKLSREALLTLIAEPVAVMDGDTFNLQLSRADRQTLGDNYLDELRRRAGKSALDIRLAGEPLPDKDAGPVLSDPEGRQHWDNRLSARLTRLWPELRRQVAAATGLNAVAPEWEAHS